ncbi:Lig_chan domain-containing protein/SBP_bac_3 domain-containing protein [Cephalotus follicularis]|uniref:Lig_chan domain-containing protein/SBP_bac_3 domain-containing protein n=1 Tax=Cephalotus follicularis TaxID=3775 RepID=A0A1Q3D651_CEPFO|nr:Lig_chan domain-containing protein/SBP_bac_3 domain-containing protein [Cephalotus follicularis]
MWPGNLLGTVPKGWAMPTNATPMIIGVPNRTSFDKFVKFEANATEPVGFCIDLFYMVLAQLDYALPHKFVEHNYRGSYDDLVYKVYNKTYDAAVGDVTVLANRTNYVDFAQPYAESGLSLIVPSKYEDSLWLFMKPFSIELWVVSGAIFIYTMLIVWFLEHRSNPEFRGPLKAQICSALWFTFSSVFFAHGERVYSHITRVVVIGWLFVVFILSSSYTASLSSLLTIRRLESNLDISSIQQRGLQVGVDDDSFIRNYLINVLNFKSENIKTFNRDSSYTSYFKNNSIAAAFLELPYEKLFLGQHCQEYTATTRTYRYGGLSFAFPKGSPFKADFSRAILNLSENGDLKKLEEKWLAPLRECSTNVTDSGVESLSLHSFWGIYLMCGATSAICVLLYLIHLLRTFLRLQQVHEASMTPSQKSVWKKTVRLARYFYYDEFEIPGRCPTIAQAPVIDEWGSSKWEYVSPDHRHISLPA